MASDFIFNMTASNSADEAETATISPGATDRRCGPPPRLDAPVEDHLFIFGRALVVGDVSTSGWLEVQRGKIHRIIRNVGELPSAVVALVDADGCGFRVAADDPHLLRQRDADGSSSYGAGEDFGVLHGPTFTVLFGDIVVPGFIDIHTHGIGASDVGVVPPREAFIGEFWLDPEYTLQRVVRYGTTAVMATVVLPKNLDATGAAQLPQQEQTRMEERTAAEEEIVCGPAGSGGAINSFEVVPGSSCLCDWCSTASTPDVQHLCANIVERLNAVLKDQTLVIKHDQHLKATLLGLHAEGPIIASLGGLPPSHSSMSDAEFEALLDLLGPNLRLMTISPSSSESCGSGATSTTSGSFSKIRSLVRRNVRPCLGHDVLATEDQILGALRAAADEARRNNSNFQKTTSDDNFHKADEIVPEGVLRDACSHITHAFNVQKFRF